VGPSLPAVYAVQLVLGLVDIVLIHRLTGLAFGRRAATAAAALAALYASFPFLETKLLSSVLALTLLLAGTLVLARAQARPAAWRWALGGTLLGLASLTRTDTLLLAPFVALWCWRFAGPAARGRAVVLVAAAWTATILPVAAHNVRSGAGLTLISSQGGIT